MSGKLITLEGIDGSGKSTALERLKAHPSMSSVVFTREPTNDWIGEAVERAIHSDTDHLAELFLFTADHAEHISKVIQPALGNGKTVISDRYSDSRYAYQGVTLSDKFDDPIKWIQSIHNGWTVVPDMTILLTLTQRSRSNDAATGVSKPSSRRSDFWNVYARIIFGLQKKTHRGL